MITEANGNDIKVAYKCFGHKNKLHDINQGITLFGYNALGELDKQKASSAMMRPFCLGQYRTLKLWFPLCEKLAIHSLHSKVVSFLTLLTWQ
ncbi:hypothetical protein [Shewanella glacialimarina]|uniref:hypothetical protein n=1 Tax=Shewanella glacialimarina TaxID=2590884 RepID=UPI001CF81C39|nr:hypothetical protein [Shewanella glacialimarina]UCX04062.1 hypothetical protein FJ709_05800 [Shewanella glacialimarina]